MGEKRRILEARVSDLEAVRLPLSGFDAYEVAKLHRRTRRLQEAINRGEDI